MYSSGYYPQKRKYHSSYGRKRIYGSAYQKGLTTKYQRYGRTVPLDPGYVAIPRSLPTRQSQLQQVEELRKAGLIPYPEPPVPQITYTYISRVFRPTSNELLLGNILAYCANSQLDPSNIINISYSGKFHYQFNPGSGNTSILRLFKAFDYSSPIITDCLYFKFTASTQIDIAYTVVISGIIYNEEWTPDNIRFKKAYIIFQMNDSSNSGQILYDSNDNTFAQATYPGSISLNDANWHGIVNRNTYILETRERSGSNFYSLYQSIQNIDYGYVSTLDGVFSTDSSEWNSHVSINLMQQFSDLGSTFANSTFNNGVQIEFAIPDN